MSTQKIPVACIQTRAHDREDFERRFPAILTSIERACERGARLVVAPEGTVPAYVLGAEPVDPELVARAQTRVARIARRHGATIVYGSARTIGAATYNTATTIGPDGALLGAPAKHFLWHFDRRWFASGTSLEPVETPLGRLGILVCADGRIPTIARTLVERGAEILVMPTAWVTSGRNPVDLENVQADLFVNVRAYENGVPFVVANKVGVEARGVAYCGKSTVVGADGIALARASQHDEEILLADVETSAPDPARAGERLMASALYMQSSFEPADANRPARARIAFTTEHDAHELTGLAAFARTAEARYLIACGVPERLPTGLTCVVAADDAAAGAAATPPAGDLRYEIVSYRRLRDPAALVPARLAGVDLFLCTGYDDAEPMALALLRTRAAELRAFVVGLDRRRARAVACDPDGTVVAGTFGDLRVAAFAYDRARSDATVVAPGTDVLEGLRATEAPFRAALLARYPELASAE